MSEINCNKVHLATVIRFEEGHTVTTYNWCSSKTSIDGRRYAPVITGTDFQNSLQNSKTI